MFAPRESAVSNTLLQLCSIPQVTRGDDNGPTCPQLPIHSKQRQCLRGGKLGRRTDDEPGVDNMTVTYKCLQMPASRFVRLRKEVLWNLQASVPMKLGWNNTSANSSWMEPPPRVPSSRTRQYPRTWSCHLTYDMDDEPREGAQQFHNTRSIHMFSRLTWHESIDESRQRIGDLAVHGRVLVTVEKTSCQTQAFLQV